MAAITHWMIAKNSLQNGKKLFSSWGIIRTKYFPVTEYLREKHPHSAVCRHFSFQSLAESQAYFYRKIAESDACGITRDALVGFHDITNLPWWSCIFMTTVIVKFFYSFPLKIYQSHLFSRLETCNTLLKEIKEKVQLETAVKQNTFLWTPIKAKLFFIREMRKQKKILIEKYNCHPAKPFLLIYFELPVWVLLSVSWRTMPFSFHDNPIQKQILMYQMSTEGPFWCQNLFQPDATLVLSFVVSLTYLISIELGILRSNVNKRFFFKILVAIQRLLAIFAFFACTYMPSSVSLYWASSALLSLMQNMLFFSSTFRQIIKIPPLSNQSVSTVKEIFDALQKKWFGKNR